MGRVLLPSLLVGVLLAGASLPAQPRALQVLVCLALLAALGEAGRRIARRLVPEWEGADQAVAAFTVAVALAVVPATWMGHFGVMQPWVLLVWVAGVYLLVRLVPAPRPALTSRPPAEAGGGGWMDALLLAAGLALLLAWGVGLAREFPDGVGTGHFDDASYHLTAVAVWRWFGDLRMVKFTMGDPSTPFYPVAGEVASWVLLAPFRDSDVAARWSQLPFALASLAAVAALARRLGLPWRSAALAVLLYGSIRKVIPDLALSAGNDHVASFFTLAGLLGVVETARRPRTGVAVFTGLALGLLAGTKYIGLMNAATLISVLVFLWFFPPLPDRGEGDGRGGRGVRLLRALLVVFAVALAAGGYTYLRNAVSAGNPVFPAPIHSLGLPGWEGTTLAHRRTGVEAEIDVWHFLVHRQDLFGHVFAFTLLPAALLAPFAALLRRGEPWRERVEAAVILALPAVFFLQFLFLIHDHRENRYFLAGIAVAAVAFAWLAGRAGKAGTVWSGAALLLVAFHSLRRPGLEGWQAGLAALALVGLSVMALRIRLPAGQGVRPGRAVWIGIGSVALLAWPLGEAVAWYQEVKLRDQPAVAALERLAGPAGAPVAYVGWNQPYPFFGRRLENQVNLLPRSGNPADQYYRWGEPVERPFKPGNARRWRRILHRYGVGLVVVVRSPSEDPERRWMARRPGEYRRVYQDATTEIWKVLPYNARDAERPVRPPKPGNHRRRPAGARP